MILKTTISAILIGFLVSCATPRTKYTDPVMRTFLLCDNIDKQNCARLKQSLVSSGKWIVVDRDDGLKAAKQEQDFQYKDADQRVNERERYSIFNEMYGAGGVFVASSQCAPSKRFWAGQQDYDCVQTLSVIDTKTGVIISSVENLATDAQFFYGEQRIPASWSNTVDKLNDAFPKKYESVTKHEKIVQRENESEAKSKSFRQPTQTEVAE